MLNCKFCSRETKNGNSLRNHERLCKSNPNRDIAKIDAAREKASRKVPCDFCSKLCCVSNIAKHQKYCLQNPTVLAAKEKTCPVCKKLFYKEGTTCSSGCANTFFRSGYQNGNWSGNSYRKIAQIEHEFVCIICGEQNIVAVHHYDEDKTNNDPSNLVPLCPTHHQYVHSRFRHLVIDRINQYVSTRRLESHED